MNWSRGAWECAKMCEEETNVNLNTNEWVVCESKAGVYYRRQIKFENAFSSSSKRHFKTSPWASVARQSSLICLRVYAVPALLNWVFLALLREPLRTTSQCHGRPMKRSIFPFSGGISACYHRFGIRRKKSYLINNKLLIAADNESENCFFTPTAIQFIGKWNEQ